MAIGDVLIEARDITKSFGRVEALQGASLTIHTGEILALIGDNGAGKSTFVGILSGILSPTRGELLMEGQPLELLGVESASRVGITTVHQDLALCPDLTPAENAFLSRELRRPGLLGWLGFTHDKEMQAQTKAALEDLGVFLQQLDVPIRSLSGGQRQVVAVARAAMWARKLIILDEPTAALGARQSRIVNETIQRTRANGRTILLVSHDLPTVLAIADRIAVMRQGRVATVIPAAGATVPQIVSLMLGHEGKPAASEPEFSA
jgi:simple sugar transport system ATP-binding protein